MGRGVKKKGNSIILEGHDLFLNVGRTQLAEYFCGTAVSAPRYIAVGTKTTTVADPRTLTALEDELDREIVESRYRETYTAKLVAVFTRKRAVGEWQELGLLDAQARAVMLSNCDTTTNWTSSNTLSVETSDYREGAGALEATGSATLDFRNAALAPDYGAYSFSTEDKLQLWYYVDNVANLTGSVYIEISSSTTDDTDEYEFEIATADLSNGWNWISRKISDATAIGSPNLNAIVRFRLHVTKSASVLSRIDRIRLFGNEGNLWCRAELTTPVTKQLGEVRNVYWYIEYRRGSSVLV